MTVPELVKTAVKLVAVGACATEVVDPAVKTVVVPDAADRTVVLLSSTQVRSFKHVTSPSSTTATPLPSIFQCLLN